MPQELKYDFPVRRPNRATAAGFGSVLFGFSCLILLLASTASAQVNGMPASVTSPGFGGHQVNGVRPSVTSLGSRGYTPAVPTCCFRGTIATQQNPTADLHHHHHDGPSLRWGGAVYPVPYYGYSNSADDSADAAPDDQYNGGPTIFDRRGPGTAPAPAPYASAPRRNSMQPEPPSGPAAQPGDTLAPDQPQTLLVFKDGHQLEVANYAIVGSTLYDLTDGRHHKIPLAELDLTATAKQNDDRGIDFQVPAHSEAN